MFFLNFLAEIFYFPNNATYFELFIICAFTSLGKGKMDSSKYSDLHTVTGIDVFPTKANILVS